MYRNLKFLHMTNFSPPIYWWSRWMRYDHSHITPTLVRFPNWLIRSSGWPTWLLWHTFHPGEGAQVCEIQGNEFSCPTADASINATCDRERCPLQGPPMAPIMELQLLTGSTEIYFKIVLCIKKTERRYYICTKHKTELLLIEFGHIHQFCIVSASICYDHRYSKKFIKTNRRIQTSFMSSFDSLFVNSWLPNQTIFVIHILISILIIIIFPIVDTKIYSIVPMLCC